MTADPCDIPEARQDNAAFGLLNRPITAEEIAHNTAQIGRAQDAEIRHPATAVICLIGDEKLALRSTTVARVHKLVATHRVPHRTTETICGLCNIDGQLVLCASLASLLQIPPPLASPGGEAQTGARLVMIGDAPDQWAFPVDAVCGVSGFDPGSVQTLPLTVEQSITHYSAGIIHVDGGQATLLDTERLIRGFQAALK